MSPECLATLKYIYSTVLIANVWGSYQPCFALLSKFTFTELHKKLFTFVYFKFEKCNFPLIYGVNNSNGVIIELKLSAVFRS